MTRSTIGIVGAGQMGSGIAEVCARAGHPVLLHDLVPDAVGRALSRIRASMDKAVERGKATPEDASQVGRLIQPAGSLEDLGPAALVIEAVAEVLPVKQEVFQRLSEVCAPDAILASNTSSLSIIQIATAASHPGRVVGIHFFNPVPVMKLVEIVPSILTGAPVIAAARAFAEGLGKTVVQVQDTPGFVVNALLIPYLLDAIRMLEAGIAAAEDIDAGMTLGCGHPMGPLALADYIGLDVVAHIADSLWSELREARYAPPRLLRHHVAAGHLGRKAGQGFFPYPAGGSR